MKHIFIIAGPNGAGKTTFARDFLPREAGCLEFVNADLIAAGLSPFQPEHAALAAGRLMIERIHQLARTGQDFAFETTLATRNYLNHIPDWQKSGYRVHLYFLKLPDPGMAIRRVAQRVKQGGHSIPETAIRRRFERGWNNLRKEYIPLVDHWIIYDSSHMPPLRIDYGSNPPRNVMEDPVPHSAYSPADKTSVSSEASSPGVRTERSFEELLAGSDAAMLRAAKKAIAEARAAGLEPVLAKHPQENNDQK